MIGLAFFFEASADAHYVFSLAPYLEDETLIGLTFFFEARLIFFEGADPHYAAVVASSVLAAVEGEVETVIYYDLHHKLQLATAHRDQVGDFGLEKKAVATTVLKKLVVRSVLLVPVLASSVLVLLQPLPSPSPAFPYLRGESWP